jgi:hypothetical protein
MRRSNSSNFSGRLSSARQAEAIFHQRGLARPVAVVHAAELADQHVALVQEHQRVGGR